MAAADEPSILDLIAGLAARADAAESENTRLKAKKTIDDVKAQMMEPYANKVFSFVVFYCIVVALMLVASATAPRWFHLSDTILSIVAGSTAASVIGLIGIVVSGLFGVSRGSKSPDA